jgi:hypothetical protein
MPSWLRSGAEFRGVMEFAFVAAAIALWRDYALWRD